MIIMQIQAAHNGAHRNQTISEATPATFPIPAGWAVVPEGMELESFPFGAVETAEVDGVPTVTGWTPGEIPEPDPPPEPGPTLEEQMAALSEQLTTTQLALCEVVEMMEGDS